MIVKMEKKSEIISPKEAILMKVGFHGIEELDAIIERKQLEIRQTGFAFWGYGGTLCHPLLAIQPFINSLFSQREKVEVLFVVTSSPFHSKGTDVSEFSIDGVNWQDMPKGIRVSSSKFALVITGLEKIDGLIDASCYEIAFGPSKGKPLASYFRGRVDKAVITLCDRRADIQTIIPVAFRATLVSPHAILVR